MTGTHPESLDTSSSVLFLGSGFTREATNINNTDVPAGDGLKAELSKSLGVQPSDYDLKVLAEEFASQPGKNLYQLLYGLFTIAKLTPDQSEVLRNPWLRIYTTNYDDAVEFAHHRQYGRFVSFNYDDPKPKRLEPNTIVVIAQAVRL